MQKLSLLVAALVLSAVTIANNVNLTNVSIINNGPGNIQVKFDISWENSWRVNTGPNNYDGVWVFFKYRNPVDSLWKHVNQTGSNNVIPAGASIYQTNDLNKAGAIIYRESNGIGNISFTNVRLGVSSLLPYDIDLKGFALEMVYVPAPAGSRPFFGDGDGVNESINAFHYTDNTATTQYVVPMKADANTLDDDSIEVGGLYVYSNDTIQTAAPLGGLQPFPTMKAEWCMKYEVTQASYRDFLNCLTYTQQTTRTANAPNSGVGTKAIAVGVAYRNFIEVSVPGVSITTPAVYGCDFDNDNIFDESTDGEWIACNFLTWPDLAAFLDWSGLAPMSEFQYERFSRGSSSAGPNPAFYSEFAWGSSDIVGTLLNMTGAGTANETFSNPSLTGNAWYTVSSNQVGPARSGIFAGPNTDRAMSGATYYGIMEMTGNVYEQVITVANWAGRTVRIVPNGNGTLSAAGNAQLSIGGAGFWPGMEGNITGSIMNTCSGSCEVTGNAGIMRRGGAYSTVLGACTMSYRSTATPSYISRDSYMGGRGVLYIR